MADASKDLTRRLRLLGLAAFASMASTRWCDALLPVLATEFAATAGQTSAVVYGFALAYGVMQLVYGPIGDRFGKDRVVSLAVLSCTVGALASALAPSLGWLVAARVLTGATAAGVIPLTMAWIGDQVPWAQRQAVLARFLGATMGGMIAGQWLSGVFADLLGWRAGFVAVAALFAVAGVAMRLSFRASPADGVSESPARTGAGPAPASSLQRFSAVLANRQARLVLVIVAVEGAFAAPAMAFAPSHLHGRFGLAVSTAGAVATLFGVGGLLYSKSARWMLARTAPLRMARSGGLLAGGAWILFAWVPSVAWTLPLCALAGLGFYMLHNTLQTQATQMAPSQRGTAVSLFACALFLGQSMGMSAASWLVDGSSTTAVLSAYGLGLALVGVSMAKLPLAQEPPPRAAHDGTGDGPGGLVAPSPWLRSGHDGASASPTHGDDPDWVARPATLSGEGHAGVRSPARGLPAKPAEPRSERD